MAIYRGVGGPGDATNDATNQSILAAASAVAAAQSEANAASSAVSASTSATNAATSATNAASSASAAASSATSASNSATAATNAETAAETAQAAAETAETNAETAATNAATSATNAANSATSATTSANDAHSYSLSAASSASTATTQAGLAGGSATAAATSEANAAVSETNAATSETNAATSATNAASSATSASTSASTATTQATNAASSATAAATSATNAANSATSASTSASTATTQATNAATSATNSANSATASASSATNAAASAAAAAASLDSFDDRYLGSKTADPTLDNDGNALVTGALYYNSVAGEMRVYDGSLWIPASAATQAILTVYRYTATAGQTTFSGNDDNSLSLAYTVGSAIVTLNGVTLEVGTDVTATTGTSIVLTVGAAADDEVNIYAFSTFDVANTYTQAQADAEFLRKAGEDGVTVTNGNLGLGVTPSAWSASWKAMQSTSGYFGSFSTGVAVGYNNYSDSGGTYRYLANGYAQQYQQAGDGSHFWRTAPTGTAGNAISFTQAMTLDASGNLGIGTSSPINSGKLSVSQVSGVARVSIQSTVAGNSDAELYLECAGTNSGSIRYSRSGQALILDNGGAERMRIDPNGYVFIGKTANDTTNAGLWLDGGTGAGYGRINFIKATSSGTGSTVSCGFYYNGTQVGNINNTSTATAYVTSSDYRLKENIQPMQNALGVVAQLNPVTYNWKADGSNGQGFIAHELQAVVHDCVTGEKDAVDEDGKPVYQGIDTSFLVATLCKAIQEQQEQINQLTAKVAALETK